MSDEEQESPKSLASTESKPASRLRIKENEERIIPTRKEALETVKKIESGEYDVELGDKKVGISFRVHPRLRKMIKENVERGPYSSLSGYLRNVSVGWDRSAPVVARSGMIVLWLLENIGDLPEEKQEELESLLEELFGTKDTTEELKVVIRHLLQIRDENLR